MKVGLIGDSLTEGRPGVSFFSILQEKYPSITFINLGKPGETIKSLYTRLDKTKLDTNYDLVFLWIGVNDVYSKLLKIQAQPIAKDHEEFKAYFHNVLDMIRPSSKQIVVVSPAVIGENTNNLSNNELRELTSIIEEASNHSKVSFLNLNAIFEKQLAQRSCSDYISTDVFSVMKDVLFYKKPKRIDHLSSKRGLFLTLDGIHLNSNGAMIVVKEYSSIIDRVL
ncbi:GDSL-type esterase/lipase family protein [Paucisalibacillus globulus]|uniref:GDSL-type esterase/lipase family protein n=1 Tax=Paucisalibacillus globulus TaxID=351095 RepID=UPI00041356D4|nr:GDSL-type esterase/lipase family protein [Paucisalibacillus globulus]